MLRALALTFALLAPTTVGAATLGTFTNDYDTFTDLNGADAGTFDFILDTPTNGGPVFTDSFDISSLAGQIIEELVLTVTYGGELAVPAGSNWFLDLYGDDPNSQIDDVSVNLITAPPGGLGSVTLTATNLSGNAFFTAVNNLQVDFGFRDDTGGFDLLRIYDAVLTVNGTAVVPLPAPILLLLMALVGLGVSRRRMAANHA